MTDYYDEEHEDLEFDEFGEDLATPSPYGDFVGEQLLLQLRDLVADAPKVPLSSSAMIGREEVLGIVDEVIARLPDELRAARWLLKERDEYLTKVRHEGEEIIVQARTRAEQLVQRTEIIKAADQRAWEIVEQAEADARRLRHEVEDFCDQKLASFEIVLERTMHLVASGRAKLQGTNLTAGIPVDEGDGLDQRFDDAFEDQGPPRGTGGFGSEAPFDVEGDEDAGRAWTDGPYSDLPPPPAQDPDRW